MAIKFNGVDGGDGGVRWYDANKGEIIHKNLEEYGETHECTELEFSRKHVGTHPRNMYIHPDHIESPGTEGAFWINGHCSDKDLRITFATGERDKIVISKNYVDFMFCSTDQSFTSCFNLSHGDGQLKLFNRCPGYYITYITDGESDYEYCGKMYTHPKMQARAWLFESSNGQHYTVGRPYGKSGYELRDTLRRWLPNGTEVGWKLSEEQLETCNGHQYDNWDVEKTVHDRYDATFNSKPLYDDQSIKIEIKDKL